MPTPCRLQAKSVGIFLAGSLLLASAGFGCKGGAAADDDKAPESGPVAVETAKVEKRTMRDLLPIAGSFVAAQGGSARLTAGVAGRVATVRVREGDMVRQGDPLATVDPGVQNAQRSSAQQAAEAAGLQAREAEMTYRAAESDQLAAVKTAEIGLATARLDRDTAVNQATLDYETAVSDQRRILAGARPQEVAQARQATIQARVTRDRARTELERDQALAKEGYVARRQLDDATAAFQTAESAVAAAEAAESLLREGARPEERQSAELKVTATRRALANAKTVGDQHVRQAETALAQAKQAVLAVRAKGVDAAALARLADQKRSDTAAAAATVALTEIRAPFSGRITRRWLNPGDFADTTNPVLEIAASGEAKRVDFVANVPATDAARIHPGMTLLMEVGGAEPVTGKVTNVSPADPTSGLSVVRAETSATILAGTFARGQVVLATVPDAVAIPESTLLDREGKTVAFVVDGETAKMIEVATGARDEGYVQAIKGLQPGQTLVKLGQFELTDGAKVKVAEPEAKDGKDAKADEGAAGADKEKP